MAASEQELIKIIDTKQTFADLAYKEYRSTKFGMTFCCPVNFNDHSIVNELCDWEAGKQTIYSGETYTLSTWDWLTWITDGTGAPSSWVKRVEPINQEWTTKYTPYGTVMNSRFLDLLYQPSGYNPADNNHTIVLKEATIDTWKTQIDSMQASGHDVDDLVRGTTKIWAVTTFNCNTINYAGEENQNTCWTLAMHRSKSPLLANTQSPLADTNWGIFDWMSLKGTGNTIDASGDFTFTMKVNTNSAGAIRNGGNDGDKVWFLLDLNGEGTGGLVRVSSTDSGEWNYVGMTNADFEGGATTTINQTTNIAMDAISTKSVTALARGKTPFAGTTYTGTGTYLTGISPAPAIANLHNGFNCIDDPETLVIQVEDSLGNVIKDYPVIIDNTFVGKTDAGGMFYYIIKNAGEDTKHMINCKCFTTTGKCNQQLIKIVSTTNPLKPTCTQKAIDCL